MDHVEDTGSDAVETVEKVSGWVAWWKKHRQKVYNVIMVLAGVVLGNGDRIGSTVVNNMPENLTVPTVVNQRLTDVENRVGALEYLLGVDVKQEEVEPALPEGVIPIN